MKNSLLIISILTTFFIYSQDNNFPNTGFVRINTQTPNHYLTVEADETDQANDERIRLFSAGKFFSSHSERNFNFSTNPNTLYESVIFTARRHTGQEFLNFSTGKATQATKFFMKNNSNQEFFKVAHDPSTMGTVTENFIHMPRPNSRIVIGNWGNYLASDGHKLVVSNGSALVEGDTKIDGNVMIGTDSFEDTILGEVFKLSVNGNVRARKVRVYATTWADYVFEEDYELMPLQDLEIFIKENKHLPNVPSEAKVLNEGIDVGDTNRVLLEKVEELTLYVIELNKEIERLKENESKSDCVTSTQTDK